MISATCCFFCCLQVCIGGARCTLARTVPSAGPSRTFAQGLRYVLLQIAPRHRHTRTALRPPNSQSGRAGVHRYIAGSSLGNQVANHGMPSVMHRGTRVSSKPFETVRACNKRTVRQGPINGSNCCRRNSIVQARAG